MQPSSSRTGPFGPQLPLQTGADDRRPADRRGVAGPGTRAAGTNADGDVDAARAGRTAGRAGDPTGCRTRTSHPRRPPLPALPGHPFQFHHQPFNYFANYAPGTPGARTCRTRRSSIGRASASDQLQPQPVSFVKPIGEENEHPGYASEPDGSDHLVDLLQAIEDGACAKDTMVDRHLRRVRRSVGSRLAAGPGQRNGPHDVWGPGTRIPALVIAPQ